jgi:hypothetical protein
LVFHCQFNSELNSLQPNTASGFFQGENHDLALLVRLATVTFVHYPVFRGIVIGEPLS